MSGFSTILGGGGSGIATVNFSIQASATGTIPALYIANSITDTAGFIVAIQNTNVGAITLNVAGGSIVNASSYAAITTSNSVTIQPGQTVVLETDVANLNYYIVAYSQAVEFTGGLANQLLYQIAPNNTGYIAAGTNNQVLSNVAGVPTWATSAPLALDLTGGAAGQIVYQAGTNNTAFSAAGTTNQVLLSGGTGAPTWATSAPQATNITGGAAGSLPYQTAANTTTLLPVGTNGQVLTTNGTAPQWSNAVAEAANLTGGVAGSVVYQSGAGVTGYTLSGSTNQLLQSNGAGTPTWTSTLNINTEIITQGGNVGSPLTINSNNTRGGVGFAEVMAMTNTNGGSTNPNKYLRLNSTGTLEFINSGYTATIFSIADSGIIAAGGALFTGNANTNINPNLSNKNGIQGSNGYITYQDNFLNVVLGDYTQTNHDTWIESGRDIFFGPNGSTSQTTSNASRISNAGTFYLNCTSLPAGVTTGGQLILNSGGDMATFKSSGNGNNGVSLWQTGTTTNAMIAFQKGAVQTQVGSVSVSTTNTTYNTTSDYRIKDNVVDIADGLKKVSALRPVEYDFNYPGVDHPAEDVHSAGFIAHEVQAIYPYAVTGEKDAVDADGKPVYQSVDYGRLTPLLVKAIQEQQVIIEALQARLDKAGL